MYRIYRLLQEPKERRATRQTTESSQMCVAFGKLFGRLWPLALTSPAARWKKNEQISEHFIVESST